LPVELQQLLLNIFRDTFPASKEFEGLKPVLEEIKNALVRKDFDTAFGSSRYLEAYSVRWSPSRALAYANLLIYLSLEVIGDEEWISNLKASDRTPKDAAKIVCFGGGAADLVAFAGLLRHLRPEAAGRPEAAVKVRPTIMNLHLVDRADWSSVVSSISSNVSTPPILSKYASPAVRLSNASLLANRALGVSFTKANILESNTDDLRTVIGHNSVLLTLMFTLNDLYLASIPKTTGFLLKLTVAAPKNTLLLVVDTPGAFTEVAKDPADDNTEEHVNEPKRYPMHWLMDKVLLDKGVKKEEGIEGVAKWEKIMSDDSRVNKLEEGLRYPVLENSKFQVHLFRRL
ncbi:hypothetical protein K504DRAFT_340913, partial [Pleomassaria siparia CBS 279.74]